MLVAILGCAEEDRSVPEPEVFDATAVVIDGVELADGDLLPFTFEERGPPTGWHEVTLGAALVGAEEVWLEIRIRDTAGAEIYGMPVPAALQVWPEGWVGLRTRLYRGSTPEDRDTQACALDGAPVVVEVTVSDLEDDAVTDTVAVSAVAAFDVEALDCP